MALSYFTLLHQLVMSPQLARFDRNLVEMGFAVALVAFQVMKDIYCG